MQVISELCISIDLINESFKILKIIKDLPVIHFCWNIFLLKGHEKNVVI